MPVWGQGLISEGDACLGVWLIRRRHPCPIIPCVFYLKTAFLYSLAPSVELFKEVLRRGGSAIGPTTSGGGILGAEVVGVDPPLAEVGGIPVTTCKA
ncbi:UNVERIFIED_CONTAM: hypothetical protein Sradi_2022200 [Sesamum radiatum]|uniref:Uncharacterized protein n=1 Tax=Sesamum radiatum TaxID=300843 RepID=A0AAW2TGN9_SESRA